MQSTERFTDRVATYVKYRPTYPTALLDTLRERTGLTALSVVADIGSGTGISTEIFLLAGCTVYAVEPNAAMREVAETQLGRYEQFHSVTGTAEVTTLPTASVDYVTAGQAFHWFDIEGARREFARILRPDGWVALFWNTRLVDTTPFLRAYEELLLQFGTDYVQTGHRNIMAGDDFSPLFANGEYETVTFPNVQMFDFEGSKGRLMSSSYIPNEGQPTYALMIAELERIFNENAVDGKVAFEYMTELFFGRVQRDL